jgi:hypothetical protein
MRKLDPSDIAPSLIRPCGRCYSYRGGSRAATRNEDDCSSGSAIKPLRHSVSARDATATIQRAEGLDRSAEALVSLTELNQGRDDEAMVATRGPGRARRTRAVSQRSGNGRLSNLLKRRMPTIESRTRLKP